MRGIEKLKILVFFLFFMINVNFLRSKKNVAIILICVALVSLLAIFVVKPSIIGYGVYKQAKNMNYTIADYGEDVQDLKSKLLMSNTNLSVCDLYNERILTGYDGCVDSLSGCEKELSSLKTGNDMSKAQCEKDLGEAKSELNKKSVKIEGLEEDLDDIEELKKQNAAEIDKINKKYDSLAQNLANNLCCKAKIDNQEIRYYKIENDMVKCLEQGELKISC